MAREKQRSVTAEDAASIMDESVEQRKNSSPKQPNFYNNKPVPAARSNKTLGWFLNDELFKKRSDSQSPVEEMGTPPTRGRQGSTPPAPALDAEKKRRRGQRRGGRKTSNSETKYGSESSAQSEELNDDKMKIVSDFKEDFWYYDVASDGYYYEQSGARGWRRRMPPQVAAKMRAEQDVTKFGATPQAQAVAAAAAAAQAQALLHSAYFGQPATKYYDAASDGYFYEMASVDGWKRRDPEATPPGLPAAPAAPPARPVAASKRQPLPVPQTNMPPMPTRQSYGATLARGQLPVGYVTVDESSSALSTASSSSLSSEATTTADSGLHDFLVEQFDKAMALEQEQLKKETAARPARPDTLHLDSLFTAQNGLVSTPSLLPQTAQNQSLAARRLNGFDVDKFIQDMSFNDFYSTRLLDLAARSPAMCPTPGSIPAATPHTPHAENLGSYDWLSSGFRGAAELVNQATKLDDGYRINGIEKIWQQPLHG